MAHSIMNPVVFRLSEERLELRSFAERANTLQAYGRSVAN
jgi:hypothetical protein